LAQPFKKPFLIYNPVAGHTHPQNLLQAFQHACQQHGWDAMLHETSKDENLLPVVENAIRQGCDLIIAAGGDGTVSMVASALVKENIPLAIIPSGTGNLLARQLKLPLNYQKAFAYIAKATEHLFLDAMQINHHSYILNVSVGLTSTMIAQTTREEKRKFGILAYVWNAFRLFIGFQPHRFRMNIDSVYTQTRASEVFITNTALLKEDPIFKTLFEWTEDESIGVFIIKAKTLWSYMQLFLDFILRKAHKTYNLTYYPLRDQFVLQTKKPLTVQADGEVIGQTPLQIHILPRAVEVLIPPKPEIPKILEPLIQQSKLL
jgi:YegS/Rv2252/BmrU family lipid kinase